LTVSDTPSTREDRIQQFTELDDEAQEYALLLVALVGTGPELSMEAAEYLLYLAEAEMSRQVVRVLDHIRHSLLERGRPDIDGWLGFFAERTQEPTEPDWKSYRAFLAKNIDLEKAGLDRKNRSLQQDPDNEELLGLIQRLRQTITEKEQTLARLQTGRERTSAEPQVDRLEER
jgi:hypothetical protein